MDPLLKKLEESGFGLSLYDYYAGGYLHADDIRTLATSCDSLEKQASVVSDFVEKNFLKLNRKKCEVVAFSKSNNSATVDGCFMPVGDVGKCLGFWWKRDLFATKCVDENIRKARKAFFGYGSIGAFQGSLSPISSVSVIETCVLPALLYGAENWILTPVLVDRLESFQGELAKRILCWPKHHSNTAATLAVGLHSVKSIVLEAKLSFLQKILDRGSECVSGRVVEAMEGRLEDLCLVKECRELEEAFGVKLTDSIISEDERWGPVMKTMLRQKDRERHIARCKENAPLITRIEKEIGWKKLWSDLLEYRKKIRWPWRSLTTSRISCISHLASCILRHLLSHLTSCIMHTASPFLSHHAYRITVLSLPAYRITETLYLIL